MVLIPRQQACIAHCRHFRHPSHRETLSPRALVQSFSGRRDIAFRAWRRRSASGTVAGALATAWPLSPSENSGSRGPSDSVRGQLDCHGRFSDVFGPLALTPSTDSESAGERGIHLRSRSHGASISSASSVYRASPTLVGCNARGATDIARHDVRGIPPCWWITHIHRNCGDTLCGCISFQLDPIRHLRLRLRLLASFDDV